jgi:cell division protein FtsB
MENSLKEYLASICTDVLRNNVDLHTELRVLIQRQAELVREVERLTAEREALLEEVLSLRGVR